MTAKTLVYNHYGPNDIEKAIIAMTLAEIASAGGAETVVFMTCDAVELVLKDFRDQRRVAGYRALDEILESFVAAGGRFWVHDESARARGIAAENLIDCAELVDAKRTVSLLRNGGRVLA
jgi:predicted peroxiredoxin